MEPRHSHTTSPVAARPSACGHFPAPDRAPFLRVRARFQRARRVAGDGIGVPLREGHHWVCTRAQYCTLPPQSDASSVVHGGTFVAEGVGVRRAHASWRPAIGGRVLSEGRFGLPPLTVIAQSEVSNATLFASLRVACMVLGRSSAHGLLARTGKLRSWRRRGGEFVRVAGRGGVPPFRCRTSRPESGRTGPAAGHAEQVHGLPR